MAVVKKILLFSLVFSFACGVPAFADQATLEDKVRRLEERIGYLENKYEGNSLRPEGKAIQQPEAAVGITEGLEIGAGGTMIIQGTSNVNDATSGADKKASRSDASYSADITYR